MPLVANEQVANVIHDFDMSSQPRIATRLPNRCSSRQVSSVAPCARYHCQCTGKAHIVGDDEQALRCEVAEVAELAEHLPREGPEKRPTRRPEQAPSAARALTAASTLDGHGLQSPFADPLLDLERQKAPAHCEGPKDPPSVGKRHLLKFQPLNPRCLSPPIPAERRRAHHDRLTIHGADRTRLDVPCLPHSPRAKHGPKKAQGLQRLAEAHPDTAIALKGAPPQQLASRGTNKTSPAEYDCETDQS